MEYYLFIDFIWLETLLVLVKSNGLYIYIYIIFADYFKEITAIMQISVNPPIVANNQI
mgnify:CR=1 FL=1